MIKAAATACFVFTAAATHCVAAETHSGETQDGGLRLRWDVTQPGSKDDLGFGIVDLRVNDAATGLPIRYEKGQVLGWMQRETGALVENAKTCEEQIRALATQGVGRKSTIDLNQYRIVTVNRDGSVVFINPFVGFNNAKLESILDIHATPLDWQQIESRMELWILAKTSTGMSKIIVVDLLTRNMKREVMLPDGSGALQLAFDQTRNVIWAALPDLGQIARVDADNAGRTPDIIAAPNISWLSVTEGSTAYWNEAKRTLVWLEGDLKGGSWPLSAQPILTEKSANAHARVVVTKDGEIYLVPVDDGNHVPKPSLHLEGTVEAATLLDNGRRLLAVGGGTARIIDLATKQVVGVGSAEHGVTELIHTQSFIYAVGSPSGRATLFDAESLRTGQLRPVSAMMMAPDNSNGTQARNLFVPAPDGSGLLAASSRDGMVFQYVEGMMAPVGSYSNYRRAAVGLAIVDYAFREIEPGHYRANFRAQLGGHHALFVGAVSPRISTCNEVQLQGDSGNKESAPQLSATVANQPVPTALGNRIAIRIREQLPKREPTNLSGLNDVVLLVFDRYSGWQRRVKLSETKPGEYIGNVSVPRRGSYELQVSSVSANLSFVEGRLGAIRLESRK